MGVPVHGLTAEVLQAVDAATEAFGPAMMVGADSTGYPPGSAGGIPSTSSAGEGGTASWTPSRLSVTGMLRALPLETRLSQQRAYVWRAMLFHARQQQGCSAGQKLGQEHCLHAAAWQTCGCIASTHPRHQSTFMEGINCPS